MRIMPTDVARFAAIFRLTYIEEGMENGYAVIWFRNQRSEKIFYTSDEIRKTLKGRKNGKRD